LTIGILSHHLGDQLIKGHEANCAKSIVTREGGGKTVEMDTLRQK
jgi:hypothetical protein